MSTKATYQVTDRQDIEATIQVSIPAEGVAQQIEAVYRDYAKEVSVPGFRKGHVPRSFLDSRFGREVFLQESQEELQRKHLTIALTELDLRPVSTPELDIVSFGEADSFVFTASFAILPTIELPEIAGLEAQVPAQKAVSDEDVEQALADVQQQFGVLGELEGEVVSDGDLVHVKEGEQEWDTRAMNGNPITQHLVGAAVGSTVSIDAELPDGKPIKTTLAVSGLRQVVLPDVDDDLAKDAGYDDLEALKKDIRERIAKRRDDLHQQWVHGALLESLLAKTEIPLPETFVNDLVDDELTHLRESLERPESNRTYAEYLEQREQTEDELKGEIKTSIEVRIRRELVLQQLAVDLKIDIDGDELDKLAAEDAGEYGEDPVRFKARMKAEDRWDDYRLSKINERIFETLAATAIVKEKEDS
ncbi:trigger factor [Candidatus Bipolaricaulota bacterium]|nr:trigger factor [Candidatus Bipolaricaulota bacterium]TFH09782.1 MAG: trigger factor [Candidatus Atribacteria bacterium]